MSAAEGAHGRCQTVVKGAANALVRETAIPAVRLCRQEAAPTGRQQQHPIAASQGRIVAVLETSLRHPGSPVAHLDPWRAS